MINVPFPMKTNAGICDIRKWYCSLHDFTRYVWFGSPGPSHFVLHENREPLSDDCLIASVSPVWSVHRLQLSGCRSEKCV